MTENQTVALEQRYGAFNYSPLPVVLTRGQGVHVWDDQGKCYVDMMSAYSAVSHGHCHPKIVAAIQKQVTELGVVSRAYFNDKLGLFLQRACQLLGQDRALPMNSGAEAVETALKAARKWAYQIKKVPEDKAEVIVCEGNFHGRTIAILGMSSEPLYRTGFGPFPAGFCQVPYGDSVALERAITPNTAAFLVEPIQGEGGIHIPPDGYLKRCAEICKRHNVLLICDEIQTGLGRTGKLLASEHEEVKPDGVIIGKALGGGFMPVSMFLAKHEVMQVFSPGTHGSTFGGSPLAAAVGLAALDVLVEEQLVQRSAELGAYFLEQLKQLKHSAIRDIRGRGLFIGIEIDPKQVKARDICLKLLDAGLLSKETHEVVIRLAPPLVITREELDEGIAMIRQVFDALP